LKAGVCDMFAPENILHVWRKFDAFPMERLTKLWFFNQQSWRKQRDVSLMKEHRSRYGLSGNCFDLAIWLLDEFQKEGITAYPIGHDLNNENAHVAVIALDESGKRYLCDLGDQWINPILVDADAEDFTNEKCSSFFPAAKVQVISKGSSTKIRYYRPNGKISKQIYNLQPIEMDYFLQAAEYNQNIINPCPLLECRIPYKNEVAHWEFSGWESFLSTNEGLIPDSSPKTIEEWALKINDITGYDIGFLTKVLGEYKKHF